MTVACSPMDSQTSSLSKVSRTRIRLADEPAKPVVPEHVRALLGPSWIIDGEDSDLYEQLLAGVGAAVQPFDLIDWLLLKDVVALTWEIQRTRRQRESLMRMARRAAVETILLSILPQEGIRLTGASTEASRLASDWFSGDRKATKRVDELLDQARLSSADITAQSLSTRAQEFDRLDRQNELHERRRDALLQQIERRRSGWAKEVRRASDEIVDAEFKESARDVLAEPSGERLLSVRDDE